MATLVRLVTASTLMTMVNFNFIVAMKNIFKSLMLVAVAAMGFACQEANEDFAPERANEVVMTITADVDETRTYIDETNKIVKWSEGDQLKVIENSAVYRTSEAATIEDGKAKFAVSFPANTSASEFTYDAIFPASAVVEDDAEKVNVEKIKVIVKDQQKPTETSFDPQADVLVANQLVFDAQPTELNMQFKRIVALGKMTIKGLPEGAEISQVVFTAGASDVLAGRNYVNATTGKVLEYGYYGKTNILTLTYDAPISTRDIYFVCNPFEMATGDKFSVVVKSGDDTYATDVEIPAERSLVFTEGNMSTFSVTVAKQEVSESAWMLVTDVNDLAVDDQIIIAAKDYNYALSTEQKSNNRGQIAIKKSGDTLVDPSSTVQILTLTKGINANTFGLYTGSGYLYAASSSSNHLKTQTTNNANGSWKVSIDADGTATITAQGSNSRNVMQYNQSSSLFACYGSASQKAIVIYKNYVGGGADVPAEPSFSLSTSSIEFDAEGGSVEINVVAENNFYGAVTATTDADWLTIDNDDYTFNIVVAENEETKSRTATITFSAEGYENVEVVVSQKGVYKEPTLITVKEFIANADTENEYILTGEITNVTNTDFGNFDLKDSTGSIYVYGIYDNGGKAWTAKGLKEGDTITLRGKYKNYNSKHEVVDAQYISHVSAPFISVEDVSAIAEDTSATIAVKSNVAWSVSCSADWVTSYTQSGVNDGAIEVAMNANKLTESRIATFTLTAEGIDPVIVKLTQAAYSAGGNSPVYTSYTEDFKTWTENSTSNAVKGTVKGNACTWTYVGASKQYWSNISSGSDLGFAITLLKPASADATYVLSEKLSGGIKNLKLTARSNNASTGVNVYVIDLTTGVTHKVGTLNTTSKKKDFTGSYDLSNLNITGDYQIKIANKSTAAYCCIGGLSWNY